MRVEHEWLGDDTLFVLVVDPSRKDETGGDLAVAHMHFGWGDSTITDVWVAPSLRRQGWATRMADYAEHVLGEPVQSPGLVSDDGKAFAEGYDEKRRLRSDGQEKGTAQAPS